MTKKIKMIIKKQMIQIIFKYKCYKTWLKKQIQIFKKKTIISRQIKF